MSEYTVVTVDDFGPFQHAEIKLKPLTIFIGRNSVGKSMLMRLLWALASTPTLPLPITSTSHEEVFKKTAGSIIECVGRGLKPSEDDVRSIVRVCIDAFKEGIGEFLKDQIRKVFNAELEDVIRVGAEAARVSISSPCGPTVITIRKDGVRVDELNICLDDLLNGLVVDVPKAGILSISHLKGVSIVRSVKTFYDIESLINELIGKYLDLLFVRRFYLGFKFRESSIFLPDSRAGILRLVLKPYRLSTLFGPLSTVDEEFIDLTFSFAEVVGEVGRDLIGIAGDFLKELGCELSFKPVGGVYTIYVRTWSGKELPLHQAPSGIRESVMTAITLALPDPALVLIEEPEAHLHPRAIIELTKLIALAVHYKDFIILSTHSDHLIIALNNLITLWGVKDRVKELDLSKVALNPDVVSAYLITVDDGKAVVHELRVEDTGIPEDEFAKISEELLEERSKLYDWLQKS